MKVFGYLSFSFILALLLTQFNIATSSSFIFDFIHNSSLEIATTLLGFNIAIHTILIGQITNIEMTIKKIGHFKKTRKELKDNAMFNIVLLIFIFLSQLARLDEKNFLMKSVMGTLFSKINYSLELIAMSCLILIVFLIIETIQAVYQIYDLEKI